MGAATVSGLTIVDADILIDAGLQVAAAVQCLDAIERQSALAISVITQMELLVGCRDKSEMRNAERFLRRFQVVGLNEIACDTATELLRRYRLSHGLLIPDALIAATAITWDQPLLSKNQRDYAFIAGLQLLPYP